MTQIQADVLNLSVLRSLSANLSAVGAAYLADLANGTWQDVDQIRALTRASILAACVTPCYRERTVVH